MVTKRDYVNRKEIASVKVLNFKFVTTALFLILTLFVAGFAGNAAPNVFAQPETVSVQQATESDSLGGGFVMSFDADGTISS